MSSKPFLTRIATIAVGLSAVAAHAQQAAPGAPDAGKGLLLNLPVFAALGALFYFGLIRPQKAQAKKQSEFLVNLKKGDEVITTGGLIGRIQGSTDKVITLEVSPQTEIKIVRNQVQGYLKDVITA